MKFGLYGLHKGSSVEPDTLARRARLTEAAGFESLWVGDHIALPADAPDVAGGRCICLVLLTDRTAATGPATASTDHRRRAFAGRLPASRDDSQWLIWVAGRSP